MDQDWFEMRDVRRRRLDSAVWIPLRESRKPHSVGEHGHTGFQEEFIGRASIAVLQAQRPLAEHLDWHSVGLMHEHRVFAGEDGYVPADVHRETTGPAAGLEALRLVIAQPGNTAEQGVWHLHHDFVVALSLKREGDEWLAQDEGYEVAARLHRKESGAPSLLEVRAEFLKDYLAARQMALYVSSYRQRAEVREDASDITWVPPAREVATLDRWEGYVQPIHEGGTPFGVQTAVFHAARTDVDPEEDVPVMGAPNDANIRSSSWSMSSTGRKLFRVQGAWWKREWVEPAPVSPRIRGDASGSTTSFIVDASGRRELADQLADFEREEGQWLWCRPDLIPALLSRRGSRLVWFTRDTGEVAGSPDYGVHFGVNELGLVTAYAKDVASLPEWLRQVWAGFNIAPHGGVSRELLASQVDAEPASTFAAEELLPQVMERLNQSTSAKHGFTLFREHAERPAILSQLHRFRVRDRSGLFALAKDLARVTADSIDVAAIHKVLALPKDDRPGSLKSLERLVAQGTGAERARTILGPLFGVYDLRLADAHLPGGGIDGALSLVGIDPSAPLLLQARQLLEATVQALSNILVALDAAAASAGGATGVSDRSS